MNLEEARELLRSCQADRIEAQMQSQSAEAKRQSATLIIQGILRRYPELKDEASTADWEWTIEVTDVPSGADAVLQILQVDEGQLYTVREMVASLEERGWLPRSENPPNAVRTALERLRGQERGVQKVYDADGVVAYVYNEPSPTKFDEEPF